MTSATAISRFKLLMDEEGSAYFTDSNILDYLNMAQYEVLNRMVPDSLGGVVNFEMDHNVFQNIAPLVYDLEIPTSSQTVAGGSVTILKDTLRTSLRTASGDTTCSVFKIIQVGVFVSSTPLSYIPCKFVKRNNINTNYINTFKAPSSTNYQFIDAAGIVRIIPNPSSSIRFGVIKTPKTLDSGNTPDFDDYVMNQVILEAVKLAGVTVHNPEVIQNVANAAQSGQ